VLGIVTSPAGASTGGRFPASPSPGAPNDSICAYVFVTRIVVCRFFICIAASPSARCCREHGWAFPLSWDCHIGQAPGSIRAGQPRIAVPSLAAGFGLLLLLCRALQSCGSVHGPRPCRFWVHRGSRRWRRQRMPALTFAHIRRGEPPRHTGQKGWPLSGRCWAPKPSPSRPLDVVATCPLWSSCLGPPRPDWLSNLLPLGLRLCW